MKKLFFLSMALFAISPIFANEEVEALNETVVEAAPEAAPAPAAAAEGWFKAPKLSGYLQSGLNYTVNNKENSSKNSFQAKRLRLIMDGTAGELIDFRLQIEAFNGIAGSTNGNGQKNLQVMDAFATVKIMPEFKVRVGQFYTPLGYENYDISPATLETVDFSNIVYRMACRNPREYNFVDYGRDLGVMFIGDLFDSGKGFRYLHYDVALTNGQIPCKDDADRSKDVYASVTVRPIKNFNVKATYTHGEYFDTDNVGLDRFVAGAWYNDPTGLDLRAEYGIMKGSEGKLPAVPGHGKIDEAGAYVLAGYHVGKWLPIVRWDMYKDNVVTTSTNNYNRILLGCTYQLTTNTKIQVNWNHSFYGDEVYNATGLRAASQLQVMGLFKF